MNYQTYHRKYNPVYECLYTPLFESIEDVPEEEPTLTEEEADKIYNEVDEWRDGNVS